MRRRKRHKGGLMKMANNESYVYLLKAREARDKEDFITALYDEEGLRKGRNYRGILYDAQDFGYQRFITENQLNFIRENQEDFAREYQENFVREYRGEWVTDWTGNHITPEPIRNVREPLAEGEEVIDGNTAHINADIIRTGTITANDFVYPRRRLNFERITAQNNGEATLDIDGDYYG